MYSTFKVTHMCVILFAIYIDETMKEINKLDMELKYKEKIIMLRSAEETILLAIKENIILECENILNGIGTLLKYKLINISKLNAVAIWQ